MRRFLAAVAVLAACVLGGSAALAGVTTDGSTFLDANNYFYVAYTGDGSLGIDGASVLSDTRGYVGYAAGYTGTALVGGAGSKWANSANLYVGYGGAGTLRLEAGGLASDISGYIGYQPGSTGEATVTGAGSTWNSDVLYVGYYGRGTLDIEAGGRVNGGGYIGYRAGSSGALTVTGAGSKLNYTGYIYAGLDGSGALTVEAGGQATSYAAYLGLNAGSAGTATVTGLGSKWTNSNRLFVGNSGSGTLSVDDGGQLVNSEGHIGGICGTATVTGPVSKWTNSGMLYVGDTGSGALKIQGGGEVTNWEAHVGFMPGSTGVITVTGAGSAWSGSGDLYLGQQGVGTLTIEAGGRASNARGYVGYAAGSSATAIVTGAGSLWANGSHLGVGNYGSGTLMINNGGQVTTAYEGHVGTLAGSTGVATVTGPGSKWAATGALYVGAAGHGTLTLADGGKITARAFNINSQSTARLHVSGDGMVVVGDMTHVGAVNNNGVIRFYADAFLPAGAYRPISEFQGLNMTWSGSGACTATGGTWLSATAMLDVPAAGELAAGASDALTTGERLIFTDADSGGRAGASFGTISSLVDFSANMASAAELAALAATPGFEGHVLSAWDFSTDLTGSEAMLSFDVGPYVQDVALWHLSGGTWTPFTPELLTYDSHGIVSFTATQFGGYAVIPEPATLVLLVLGGMAMIRRKG